MPTNIVSEYIYRGHLLFLLIPHSFLLLLTAAFQFRFGNYTFLTINRTGDNGLQWPSMCPKLGLSFENLNFQQSDTRIDIALILLYNMVLLLLIHSCLLAHRCYHVIYSFCHVSSVFSLILWTNPSPFDNFLFFWLLAWVYLLFAYKLIVDRKKLSLKLNPSLTELTIWQMKSPYQLKMLIHKYFQHMQS